MRSDSQRAKIQPIPNSSIRSKMALQPSSMRFARESRFAFAATPQPTGSPSSTLPARPPRKSTSPRTWLTIHRSRQSAPSEIYPPDAGPERLVGPGLSMSESPPMQTGGPVAVFTEDRPTSSKTATPRPRSPKSGSGAIGVSFRHIPISTCAMPFLAFAPPCSELPKEASPPAWNGG